MKTLLLIVTNNETTCNHVEHKLISDNANIELIAAQYCANMPSGFSMYEYIVVDAPLTKQQIEHNYVDSTLVDELDPVAYTIVETTTNKPTLTIVTKEATQLQLN